MVNPEDEAVIDLRTSCTKEEAVARLLGWMKGTMRPKYILVKSYGIPEDQLPFLANLEGSLGEHLFELREHARNELLDAAEATEPDMGLISEREEAVLRCDQLIQLAAGYLADIDNELAKGDQSLLQIDPYASQRNGEEMIKLASLNNWARQALGIELAPNASGASKPSSQPVPTKPRKVYRLREQERLILEAIATIGFNPQALPKNPSGKDGVKAEARALLAKNPFFDGIEIFDKAWERLRKAKDIVDRPGSPPHK